MPGAFCQCLCICRNFALSQTQRQFQCRLCRAGTHQRTVGAGDEELFYIDGLTAALTSATNVWEVYYEYLFKSMMDGENPATNWSEGYNEGAVAITDLGPEVAEGTAEKVAEVEAALKDGSLHVFDTSKFTVNGETVTTAPIDLTFYDYSTGTPVAVYQGDTEEAITDGYFSESTLRSAPYFSLRIDGITEDADPVA